MKSLLVKLSRRRSLMVPIVTLVAIGIGISGYYIQNQQMLARQDEERAQTAEQQALTDQELESVKTETTQEADSNQDEPETVITENGSTAVVVEVKLEAEKLDDNQVKLIAETGEDKPGVCVFYLKQGNYGPESTVDVKDGKCETIVANPGPGTWEARLFYTASDSQSRGDATKEVQL